MGNSEIHPPNIQMQESQPGRPMLGLSHLSGLKAPWVILLHKGWQAHMKQVENTNDRMAGSPLEGVVRRVSSSQEVSFELILEMVIIVSQVD